MKNSVIIIPNLSNEDQVCDYLVQTKKVLEKNNQVYVIDFFETFDFLPLRRFKFVQRLNRQLYFFFLQIYLRFKHPQAEAFYFWIFFPHLVDAVKLRIPTFKIIYDLLDYHTSSDQSEKELLEQQKKYLLGKADYVFSISQTLKELYQPLAKQKIEIVPQGFALESFAKFKQKTSLEFPQEKPIIGFVGQISERLDFNLLKKLIGENPQYNFVFVGPWHHETNVPANSRYEKEFKKLCCAKNCFHFGRQPKATILSILDHFEICMIPYNVEFDFNRYCYPMKIFEYFYAGRLVISTPIVELEHFPDLIKIGEDAKAWKLALEQLFAKKWPKRKQLKQRRIALDNSWEKKIARIYECIE